MSMKSNKSLKAEGIYLAFNFYLLRLRPEKEYSPEMIANPPSIWEFLPWARVPLFDVIESRTVKVDLEKNCNGTDLLVTRFFLQAESPPPGPGSAILTPNGCVLLLVAKQDWREALNSEKKLLLNEIAGNEELAMVESRPGDDDLIEWVDLYYPI
jgi:hypothetical protein